MSKTYILDDDKCYGEKQIKEGGQKVWREGCNLIEWSGKANLRK